MITLSIIIPLALINNFYSQRTYHPKIKWVFPWKFHVYNIIMIVPNYSNVMTCVLGITYFTCSRRWVNTFFGNPHFKICFLNIESKNDERCLKRVVIVLLATKNQDAITCFLLSHNTPTTLIIMWMVIPLCRGIYDF